MGNPDDEMSVGAATAMTTSFTVDEKCQQRDSTFVCFFCFVLFCFKAEILNSESMGQGKVLHVQRVRKEHLVHKIRVNSETAKSEAP